LLDEDPAEIRIFSRDEDKQVRMSEEYGMGHHYPPKVSLNFVMGDVRNRESVRQAIRGTDIVFHAAALKQVPLCGYHVWEAVQTNVVGAENVIQAALEEDVEKVVAVSTDKAVKPVNAMGMTKSIKKSSSLPLISTNAGSERSFLRALRQRGRLPRFGYPAFQETDRIRRADYGYGLQNDPVYAHLVRSD
jgi:UDP-N-acetylglucosamine 4,6-dehydratase